MNPTVRHIAVSGSALVALLGGAAAITAASAPTASAAEMQTAIDRATGASVTLPDGRTTYVRGMDAAAYNATPEQHTVVLAAAKSDDDPAGISNGLTADGGQGAAITSPNSPQAPINGVQTGYNQQVTTQAGGGTIAIGIVVIIVFGTVAFLRVKKNDAKVFDAVIFTFLGVALSSTVIGAMITQMSNSGVGSLGGILGGLG
ncbi:hypothetical protein ABZ341_18280 [Streptomyces sp. NPDC006173]|uniref:hypothetical protein n=1 Tax=Streptomyces sp. NPDC006173 TaxID=3155349 RepID=UPI0033DF654B